MTAPGRWDDAMRRALAEAAKAGARPTLPDVPIGAVVLDPAGQVVSIAANERELTGDPTAHAEVLALRRAAAHHRRSTDHQSPTDPRAGDQGSWRLDGHTLVVTLEPCAMCAGALVLARIERLVFGAYDPKAGAVASLFDVVRDPRLNHRVDVRGGILEAECGEALRSFFGR